MLLFLLSIFAKNWNFVKLSCHLQLQTSSNLLVETWELATMLQCSHSKMQGKCFRICEIVGKGRRYFADNGCHKIMSHFLNVSALLVMILDKFVRCEQDAEVITSILAMYERVRGIHSNPIGLKVLRLPNNHLWGLLQATIFNSINTQEVQVSGSEVLGGKFSQFCCKIILRKSWKYVFFWKKKNCLTCNIKDFYKKMFYKSTIIMTNSEKKKVKMIWNP